MNMPQPAAQKRLDLREKPRQRSPVMYQKWRDLLFLHWAFDPADVQRTLPQGLYVDTFDSKAYIGIVPFFMHDVRPRFLPAIPGISNFMEVNLRTYAYDSQGNPGVWFYSLDANQWLAVQIARKTFGLPYFYARMQAKKDEKTGEIQNLSRRRGGSTEQDSFFHYRGVGPARQAQPGSLEFFLVERYLLFSCRGKKLWKGRVHHSAYPLRDAEVLEWDDHLFFLDGLERPGRSPDHILLSAGVDVKVYRVEE